MSWWGGRKKKLQAPVRSRSVGTGTRSNRRSGGDGLTISSFDLGHDAGTGRDGHDRGVQDHGTGHGHSAEHNNGSSGHSAGYDSGSSGGDSSGSSGDGGGGGGD